MAQTNYTPISLYHSTTAAAVPTSGNLVAGELALNTLDEKLYFKNSAGTVKLLAGAGAGGIAYTTTKTANYTAVNNDGVLTNTTAGAFTVTLPASPSNGNQVIVADAGGTWGTNNLTVGRNGSNIADVAQDLICDISGVSVQFVYNSSGTATWEVYAQVGGNGGASAVQYPQLIKSADYTLVLADAGYQIFHPATDTAARTFTIPANSSVAFPIGTEVLFVNPAGSQQVTVAITTDTIINMRGITGSQIVTANNILTALKITATRWMCYFADTDPTPNQYLAIAHFTTPFVTAYAWSSAGFGTKFPNPATLPADSGYSASFSPDGTALAVAHDTTPFVTAYPWSSAGFGIKFADPATLPTSAGRGVAFSPLGTEIVVAHNNTPFVTAYPWSSAGFGVKFADPATLPTGAGQSAAFTPGGTDIAIGHDTTPFVTAYAWSSTGFGAKYTNPATLPTGRGVGVAFSPTGTELAVGHHNTPFITAYPWSASGFGTKYTDPATLPTGTGAGVAFSPAGTELVIGHGTTPFVTAYPWSSSGFGVKFTNPATLPTGSGWDVAFSPAGTELIVPHNTTPFVTAYPWSVSGFGTKFADPATTPTGQGYAAALVRI